MHLFLMAGLAAGAPGGAVEACEVARSAFAASLRGGREAYPVDVGDALGHDKVNLRGKLGAALKLTEAETSDLEKAEAGQEAWSPSSCKWSGLAFRRPDGLHWVQFSLGAPLFTLDHKLALVTVGQSTPLWAGQGDICAVRRHPEGWSAVCVLNWMT